MRQEAFYEAMSDRTPSYKTDFCERKSPANSVSVKSRKTWDSSDKRQILLVNYQRFAGTLQAKHRLVWTLKSGPP